MRKKTEPVNNDVPDPKPFEIFEHTEGDRKIYSIYISDEIDTPGVYVPMLHKLRTIENTAGVLLYLAGDGGNCDGMLSIISAMKDCSAPIVATVHGNIRSAHSCIALAADQLVLYPDTVMMLHDFSGGIYGKAHELNSRLDSDMKQSREMDEKYAVPFLTEKEFKRMLDGKDWWFHANDQSTKIRVVRHNKSRKKK